VVTKVKLADFSHSKRFPMRWLPLAGIAMLAVQVPVVAQQQPTPATQAPADNMALVRDKVRADKKLVVAEGMKMSEPEAAGFWPVYDAFQADLGKLADRAMKLVEYYAANYRGMTDSAANRIVTEHLALEKDRAALLESYQPRFAKVLPAVKVARYYQIENKIRAIVNWELAKGIPLM
jgi:hypothetical protein